METTYRPLTAQETASLAAQQCLADDWRLIEVAGDFSTERIRNCRITGKLRINGDVRIENVGRIGGYEIRSGARIENTAVVESATDSRFGTGVPVAVVNENGGRAVPLSPYLTAQTAYVIAMCRHRPQTVSRLSAMMTAGDLPKTACISSGARINACGIIRDVCIGEDAVIEGAARLENGTVHSFAGQRTYIGSGVILRDFVVCGNATVDNGTVAERCYIGNAAHLAGATVTDSMFFADSHCDNGEMCSVLAGPYTISHHKSTLLIAGLFSFFNAGSGTNQSNHLLKSGPVHQGIHQRGCKYGSDAYMMLPALDGAFTTVIGRHKTHPDTEDFPFSILIENEGHSWLLPGNNLATCGAARDTDKWPRRDRRDSFSRDIVNFSECNPYIGERILRAISACEELLSKETPDTVVYRRMRIKTAILRRGLRLYRLAAEKYIGAMLDAGSDSGNVPSSATGRWSDVCGQYMPTSVLDSILDAIDSGELTTPDAVNDAFAAADADYTRQAYAWAKNILAEKLGHAPSQTEIAEAVETGRLAAEKLAAMAADDLRSEKDISTSVGYGLDSQDEERRLADFRAVRGLE